MSETIQLLEAVARGEPQATAKLLPLLYDELRQLAAQKLAQESPGQTLQPTALVHEAYLRLVGNHQSTTGDEPPKTWDGRGHFFAAAAEAMRRILVDVARSKHSQKRGGDRVRQDLDLAGLVAAEPCEDMLALDEALNRLAAKDPKKAELVKLRYFAGLTEPQAAAALGISVTTAERYWAYARAWLLHEMTGGSAAVE